MQFLALCFLLFASLPAVATANAQQTRHRHSYRIQKPHAPVSVGVYGAVGISDSFQPVGQEGGLQGQLGAYADWARYVFRPGLDARLTGHANAFPSIYSGAGNRTTGTTKLIGPRASYVNGVLHPYAEALFGTGDESDIANKDGSTSSLHGFAKLAVFGLDLDADRHLQVRVFEYAIGHVSGSPGLTVQSFTTGLVLRFP